MGAVAGFPVSELAARTGVPVPTIHAYLRRGLLPAPIRVADHLAEGTAGPPEAGRRAVDAALWQVVRHGLGVDAPKA